jgi:hypothetical protein
MCSLAAAAALVAWQKLVMPSSLMRSPSLFWQGVLGELVQALALYCLP